MTRVVDLTLDSDSDEGPSRPPPPKRQRTHIKPEPIVVDSDDDVEIVDKPAAEPAAAAAPASDGDGDEDLVITGDVGLVSERNPAIVPTRGETCSCAAHLPHAPQIANRDLPHLRHDCAVHKFAPGNAATNAQRCGQVRGVRGSCRRPAGGGPPAARARAPHTRPPRCRAEP
jgi:hypothetical protein